MIRRVFTVASAISLLMCLALVALWVRSESHWDTFRLERATTNFREMDSVNGVIAVRRVWYADPRTGQFIVTSPVPEVMIPYIAVVVLTALLPFAWGVAAFWRARRRRRVKGFPIEPIGK